MRGRRPRPAQQRNTWSEGFVSLRGGARRGASRATTLGPTADRAQGAGPVGTQEAIAGQGPGPLREALRHYLPDLVYGANDGIITTFAVVSGVAGAALSTRVILILGFANLLADGFSMGASNFLSIRSRPDGAEDADQADALRHAFATFLAFVVAGAIPIVAYLIPCAPGDRFPIAIVLTLVALYAVGAARSLVIETRWWRSGLEMLLVGAAAAVVAYAIGAFLALITGGTDAIP